MQRIMKAIEIELKSHYRYLILPSLMIAILASQVPAAYRIGSNVTLVAPGTAAPGTQVAQSVLVNDTQFTFFVYLPPTYDSTGSKKWPLIISLPAMNFNNNGGNMNEYFTAHCRNGGIAVLLQTPATCTYISDRFIVVSPFLQWEVYGSNGGKPARLNCFLRYLNTRFKVDTTLISMIGYCWGSGVSWNYSTVYPTYPAHLVLEAGNDNWASTFDLTKACNLKNISIRQYASSKCTCNDSITARIAWNAIRTCGGTMDSITFTPSNLHEIWYWDGLDTTKSIYDWMLTKSSVPVVEKIIDHRQMKNSLNLSSRLFESDRLEVIDINGQLLYNLKGNGSAASQLISPLGRGMYLIRITSGAQSSSRIYIVQK